jgi:hypothetical protein
MQRSRQSRAALFLMCSLLCLAAITGIVRGGVARGAEVPAGSLADLGAPSLTVLPYDEAEDVVTVTGQGFTPEGKVYLSIIDQMGKQLYEHRWVTASPRATYDAGIRSDFDSTIVFHAPGGELVAKFKGLCGASALIRALDDATERWTSFQVVQPPCASAAGPTIANGLLRPESLPMAALNPAGAAVANDLNTVSAPELHGVSLASVEGTIAVTGEGFAAGGRVYVAIYDQMGAKLYETRWVKATPAIDITGPRADVPEAHPITKPVGGELYAAFGGLCGAQVLIRAYDEQTALWSNWLITAPLCDQPAVGQGYGPH